MTELAKAYINEIANGNLPADDSEEAKEYRAWSYAWEQLRRIQVGIEAEMMEEANGEMYRN